MKKRKRIAVYAAALAFVLLAGCGNSKKEESLAVSENGNTVQEVSEKKDVSENSSGEGMDVLFAGTALEEMELFLTTENEAKQILDAHNIAYKTEDESTILTTILDEMLGYSCYYKLGFEKIEEEEETEPVLLGVNALVFFRDDKEFRDGLGKMKTHFGASVLEGFEMRQYEELSYTNFSDVEGAGTLYWYPFKVIPDDILKKIDDSLGEEELEKMKETKFRYMEIVEMAPIHVENTQEEMYEMIPDGFLQDIVCFKMRFGMTDEYEIARDMEAFDEGKLDEEEMKQRAMDYFGIDESFMEKGFGDAEEPEQEAAQDSDETEEREDIQEQKDTQGQEDTEEWKSLYLTYLDQRQGEIVDYQLEDINYDGVPEMMIWYDVPSSSCTFQYINKAGEVKESQTGSVSYNSEYVYCQAEFGDSGHITVYQYNGSTGNYDTVCSGWYRMDEFGGVFAVDDVECSEEEYSNKLAGYTQGDFKLVSGERESGEGEATLQEAIQNY